MEKINEFMEIPDFCLCPITGEMMDDPVMLISGHSYEKEAIKNWFERGNIKDPLTGIKLPMKIMLTNYKLREAIDYIKNLLPEFQRKTEKLTNITLAVERMEENMRQRKERLAEIPAEVEKIQSAMNDATTKFTAQIKIDKEVTDSLTSVEDKSKEIKTKASELVNKQAAAEAKKKEEEAKKEEGDKKEDVGSDLKEIKSGNIEKENLKKSGPNYQTIKDFQGKLNAILPDNQQIKADGGYGKNTEEAIRRVAKLIGGNIGEDLIKSTEDGKKLTPEFQTMVKNWTDPKIQAKIQDIVSGKSK